jgi:hypothetical protein
MATIGEGNKNVLLVVDVQVGVMRDAWDADRIVRNINIEDAHTTETMELDNGVRIEATNIIHELNTAMTWLRYPGRKNGTTTAANIEPL